MGRILGWLCAMLSCRLFRFANDRAVRVFHFNFVVCECCFQGSLFQIEIHQSKSVSDGLVFALFQLEQIQSERKNKNKALGKSYSRK